MDVKEALRIRETQFVETRKEIEMEVDKFLAGLRELPEELRQKFSVDDSRTARTLLPSLWAEPFKLEDYDAEKAKLVRYISQVKAVVDKYAEEALKCLQM